MDFPEAPGFWEILFVLINKNHLLKLWHPDGMAPLIFLKAKGNLKESQNIEIHTSKCKKLLIVSKAVPGYTNIGLILCSIKLLLQQDH